MKKSLLVLSLLFVFFFGYSQMNKVLIFSKTEGYRHKSIPAGILAIKKLGEKNAFKVVATENAQVFTSDSLKQFKAVIFLSTTGDIFNKKQQEAFKTYIQSGGGFVGIHAAADTEYDWPWYGKLVGAYFKSHPEQQKALVKMSNHVHKATSTLPNPWEHFDEWYNYKNISMSITVLATLDESSYKGGENGVYHPISWIQKYDGGKMFYTGLGHTVEAYADKNFLSHLLGGIQYVLD